MAHPELDVVVVSWECRELLRRCLESLAASPAVVHVVDNGSRDGTAAMVEEAFPEADVLVWPRNEGFARAANAGIRRGSAPYVLILNPDTVVPPGALEPLLALMEARREVGVCGCRLVREDGRFDHAARRSFPTVLGALGHLTGIAGSARSPRALSQYRAPEVEAGPVDAVNGAFMLARREALEEVGLFDEGYWLYFEDLDLCYRLRDAGWLTWYEPSVTVVHVKHGTTGRWRRPRANVAFHRGMLRFYRLHYAPTRNALVNAAVYAGLAAKLAGSLLRSAAMRRTARWT